ncbi:type II secretion system GspH family protein [Fictibacillus nanhaiensis]|uniref:type II secretion system protein n=1 Tax=Fictibacillus nanhaiensis TaxID=742169 RepID=UPI001C945808|nr:type II secretion system protein [Fictibacillus nanhaiensis]MBY6037044.1 type II secretion system GspH family protein [Fictibacillus nanhaiensis]
MLNLLKKHLKNEKGLTLIELLVVIVILGIISAIAVVAVGGVLDNSKKDAHIANAEQMINAARMAVISENNTSGATYTMEKLIELGHLESKPSDPSSTGYDGANSVVVVSKGTNTGNLTYSVTLAQSATKKYITSQSKPTRNNVTLNP